MSGAHLAIVLAGLAGATGTGSGAPAPFPLQFDREIVRLFVEPDSLRVEGHYFFLCGETAASATTLLYPYPADSLLGGARTLGVEARAPGGEWLPVVFAEVPEAPAVRWRVPLDLGAEVEVRTTYHQALRGRYARYIVTTTGAWGRPLSRARFEIHLPDGLVPVRFSFPFRRVEQDGRVYWLFEAEEFSPTQDVIVEWDLRPE